MGAQASMAGLQGNPSGSRLARLMNFVHALPVDEQEIFHDSFLRGKNKAEVCRDRAIPGAEFDRLFLRFMRQLRGMPATGEPTASAGFALGGATRTFTAN